MYKGIVSKVLDFSSHGPLISHLLAPLWIICIEFTFLMLIGDWLLSHTLFNASSPGGEGFSPLPTSVSHMLALGLLSPVPTVPPQSDSRITSPNSGN